MSSTDPDPPVPATHHGTAPLIDALNQSEQVHEKVEQAATDLSAVNAVMKAQVESTPPAKVERALRKSESVEAKVQEAATELVPSTTRWGGRSTSAITWKTNLPPAPWRSRKAKAKPKGRKTKRFTTRSPAYRT